MHAFRQARNSKMKQDNVPNELILRQVGHSSLRVNSGYTHSGYTHFTKDFVRDTVERLAVSKFSCAENPNQYRNWEPLSSTGLTSCGFLSAVMEGPVAQVARARP